MSLSYESILRKFRLETWSLCSELVCRELEETHLDGTTHILWPETIASDARWWPGSVAMPLGLMKKLFSEWQPQNLQEPQPNPCSLPQGKNVCVLKADITPESYTLVSRGLIPQALSVNRLSLPELLSGNCPTPRLEKFFHDGVGGDKCMG